MTDEQFKRLDERLGQISDLLVLIACNTAQNPAMSISARTTAMQVAEVLGASVKSFRGSE